MTKDFIITDENDLTYYSSYPVHTMNKAKVYLNLLRSEFKDTEFLITYGKILKDMKKYESLKDDHDLDLFVIAGGKGNGAEVFNIYHIEEDLWVSFKGLKKVITTFKDGLVECDICFESTTSFHVCSGCYNGVCIKCTDKQIEAVKSTFTPLDYYVASMEGYCFVTNCPFCRKEYYRTL